MTPQEAADMLNQNYPSRFKKSLSTVDINRWHGEGRIKSLTQDDLQSAIENYKIPPKRGRPRTISQCQIDNALALMDTGISQTQAAKQCNLSASMLSRVRRNERRTA